ncbi:MAG: EAL domain-containing protein [Pseudomonadota bacterium]
MSAQAVRLSNIDIDNALENKDFEVLFQPIFDLSNGALARMESFVRWRHASLGVLPPGAFISFFESQGRMSELTRYVLAEALNAYSSWRGPFAPGFSVNLALTDLSDEAFAPHLEKALRDREFPPDLLTLECPMPPVDADFDVVTENIRKLGKTGARLAIEVRGRANDFLRNVDPFPFDEIKTGGASILRFARTVRGPGLSAISDLLDIAAEANAVITAVGVEDQNSLSALRGLGFAAAQGNHLGKVGAISDFRPGRVNEVRELLGLSKLSADDLSALFRTAAPTPTAPEETTSEETASEKTAPPNEATASQTSNSAPAAPTDKDAKIDDSEAEKLRQAEKRKRLKVRQIALAKRARARDARKAAAIKRAKAKVAHAKAREAAPAIEESSSDLPAQSPNVMQERISKEFGRMPHEDASSNDGPNPDHHDASQNAPTAEDKAKSEAAPPPGATKSEPSSAVETILEQEQAPQPVEDKEETLLLKAPAGKTGAAPAPENNPARKETTKPGEQLQLAIGDVGAYFRPGVLVRSQRAQISGMPGDAAPSPADAAVQKTTVEKAMSREQIEARRIKKPDVAPNTAMPDIGGAGDGFTWQESPQAEAPSDNVDREPRQEISSAQKDHEHDASPEPSDAIETIADDSVGTLYRDELDAIAALEPRPRSRNFLTRRYKIIPNHFWPKAWKRKFHRMRAERARENGM